MIQMCKQPGKLIVEVYWFRFSSGYKIPVGIGIVPSECAKQNGTELASLRPGWTRTFYPRLQSQGEAPVLKVSLLQT